MTTSNDATPTTCFSSVLRRLLCSGGLPTHPSSDTDNPTNSLTKLRPPSPPRTTNTPAGVIARLMGLDSFPSSPNSTKISLGSIMRKSRSTSSIDFLPNFEITKLPLHHHRRVTSSLSFREPTTPTFLHDLGKSEMGLVSIQEKSKNLNKNKKSQRQSQNQTKRGVINGGRKKVVVDDGFPEERKKYKSRKRRYNHALPKMRKDDRREKKKLMIKRRESEYSEEFCMKVLVEVCRLTMVEIEGGVWVDTKGVNNSLQEISYEICQEILQFLVYEMVDELC